MRVAIDARPAIDAQKTGVGYYTWHLLHELPEVDPRTRYLAWYLHAKGAFRRRRFFPEAAAGRSNFEEHASRFPARLFSPIASRLRVPRLEWLAEFDLLFAPNFIPPPTEKPFVVTVHDVAFALFPETARHLSPRWHAGFRRGIARAARILVPSDATRNDLHERFDVALERIEVVPLGVGTEPFAAVTHDDVARVRRRFAVEGPYVVFVGGIEGRKNLPDLVRAFATLPQDLGVALVIAGGTVARDPGASRDLEAALRSAPSRVSERIVRAGYVSDADKVALLAGAEALAYPSRYEGFGFPVLEAMAAGTPVVTSDRSSLPEVAGDAAVLVDPDSPDAIAAGIERILTDEALRERLRRAGLERAASFTWERTARAIAEVLHSASGVGAERGR